jgi:hypothetical protein
MEKIRQGGEIYSSGFKKEDVFIFSKTSLNRLWLTQTPIPWILGFFPGGKLPGPEFSYSHPGNAENKNGRSCNAFKAWT